MPGLPAAARGPKGPWADRGGASGLGKLSAEIRGFGRRRRGPIAVVGPLATAAVLLFVLAGRRHEFAAALSAAAAWVLAVTALLQIVALVARSEAWHLTIDAAGGNVDRRVLDRASSMQVLGSVINGQLGVAARIAALRRSSPEVTPQVPTLIAAEFPILAVEAMLAALASFTLVAPLGLPWWLPIIAFAVIGALSAGLRQLALRKGRDVWRGLAVLHNLGHGGRVIGFVLVAVFSQIFRNWMLLHAVGVDASSSTNRGPDRGGDARPTAGRSQRRRRGCRADPRQRRRGGGSGRRGPDDGDRHPRRTVLRGVGRRRPALVHQAPGLVTEVSTPQATVRNLLRCSG